MVVESPLTVVAKSHLDFNFVATMGGPTRGQMEIMREIEQCEGSIILAYDNDPAGWNHTVIVGNFLGADADLFVALNEVDLDEMTDADLYEVTPTSAATHGASQVWLRSVLWSYRDLLPKKWRTSSEGVPTMDEHGNGPDVLKNLRIGSKTCNEVLS